MSDHGEVVMASAVIAYVVSVLVAMVCAVSGGDPAMFAVSAGMASYSLFAALGSLWIDRGRSS